MSAAHTSEEKERLRFAIRRHLEGVTPGLAFEAGAAIDARLRASTAWLEATELAVFASLPDEVDTQPLMRSAAADGKVILLPRMVGEGILEFAAVEGLEALVPGRFGVSEPNAQCPNRMLTESALVLVPGLAFDRFGGRLGRGAGYYDRALIPARAGGGGPMCLGIGFALQMVEHVPMTPLDLRLDGVVTEAEFLLLG